MNAGQQIAIGEAVADALVLDPAIFQSGFTAYNISSNTGIQIGEGTRVDAAVPVYRFTEGSFTAPSGSACRGCRRTPGRRPDSRSTPSRIAPRSVPAPM